MLPVFLLGEQSHLRLDVPVVLEAVVAGEVDELLRNGPFSEGVLEPLEEFPVEVGQKGADAEVVAVLLIEGPALDNAGGNDVCDDG